MSSGLTSSPCSQRSSASSRRVLAAQQRGQIALDCLVKAEAVDRRASPRSAAGRAPRAVSSAPSSSRSRPWGRHQPAQRAFQEAGQPLLVFASAAQFMPDQGRRHGGVDAALVVVGAFLGAEIDLAHGKVALPGAVAHAVEKVRLAAAIVAHHQLEDRAAVGQVGAEIVRVDGVEQRLVAGVVVTDALGDRRTRLAERFDDLPGEARFWQHGTSDSFTSNCDVGDEVPVVGRVAFDDPHALGRVVGLRLGGAVHLDDLALDAPAAGGW